MSQSDKLFSQNVDELGKTIRARVSNRFEQGAYLGDAKLFHSIFGSS